MMGFFDIDNSGAASQGSLRFRGRANTDQKTGGGKAGEG
jgi:hypothetical protein